MHKKKQVLGFLHMPGASVAVVVPFHVTLLPTHFLSYRLRRESRWLRSGAVSTKGLDWWGCWEVESEETPRHRRGGAPEVLACAPGKQMLSSRCLA